MREASRLLSPKKRGPPITLSWGTLCNRTLLPEVTNLKAAADTIFEPLPMTNRAMRAMVANKLVAGDHWIFLPGLAGMRALQEIDNKFYRSGPPEHFAQYVFPVDKLGFYGLAFALKRRASPAALAAFLRSQPLEQTDSRPITSIELMQSDNVIVLATPEEAAILISNFYNWLGPLNVSPAPGVSFKMSG